MGRRWRFGAFELAVDERRLLADGRPVPLGGRAFDLLCVLAEHADRVVSKDELFARVWPGLVVEDNNLTVQVSALRRVLGTGAIAKMSCTASIRANPFSRMIAVTGAFWS